jgi:MFS family permease
MIVLLVFMGVLGGGYHPAAAPLVSSSVEAKNRAWALGFHLIGGSASYFLAPLIAAAMAAAWGWRGSFIGLAIPAIIFGIAFYVLLGRLTRVDKVGPELTSVPDMALTAPGVLHRLVPFGIIVTLNQAVIMSIVAFIPLFVVDNFGVNEEVAAALIAVVYSAGLWASPLGGYISDRLGWVPVTLTVCFIAGPVIYLLNIIPYGLGFGAILLLIGIINYIRQPAAEAYLISQTSERNRSTILGIYYFSAMEGGGVLTPVTGYLIDHFGFYTSFTIAGATMLAVTVVCSIWLWTMTK